MWYVYILECKGGTLYTGVTTDVERRFREHLEKSAHYTSYNPPERVLYRKSCRSRSSALKKEAAIKRLSRAAKFKLIGAPSSLR
jgi:putative endonuclease